jgi:hypothetical protein
MNSMQNYQIFMRVGIWFLYLQFAICNDCCYPYNEVDKANILSAFCLILMYFQHGEVDCWPQDCPPTPCTSPAHLPGSCCPSCPDTPLPCTSGNSSCGVQAGLLRSEGDSWHLPGTTCTSCGCKVTPHT